MSANPSSDEWQSSRGDKWRDQLSRMEGMLRAIDAPLIDALALEPGVATRIADLGCGGGGTSLEILRRAPAGSVVHGFDISPALIAEARARVAPDAPGIAFELANVATARPPAMRYERLLARFSSMFFVNPPAAFASVAQWLAPGGRFAFAVWGGLADNAWSTTVRDVVAEVIELPEPDLLGPGPFRYGEVDVLLPLLEGAGFGQLAVQDWRGTLPIGGGLSIGEAAMFALTATAFGDALMKVDGGAFERARAGLVERFAGHVVDGAVRLGACVHLVTGTTSK